MRLSVGRQLGIVSIVSLALLAATAAVGFSAATTIDHRARQVFDSADVSDDLANIRRAALDGRRLTLEHTLADDTAAQQGLEARIDRNDQFVNDRITHLLETEAGRPLGAPIEKMSAAYADWTTHRDAETLALSRAGKGEAARKATSTQGADLFDTLYEHTETALAEARSERDDLVAKSTAQRDASRNRLIAVAAFGLVAMLATTTLISRRLVRNLGTIQHAANLVATGDLDARAPVAASDETGALAESFNAMAERLRALVADQVQIASSLTGAVDRVAGFAGRVATGDLTSRLGGNGDGDDSLGPLYHDLDEMANELQRLTRQIISGTQTVGSTSSQLLGVVNENSAAANEQAAAIAEVSSTVDELRASTEHATQRANALLEQAERALVSGDEGRAAVQSIVEAMDRISEKTGALAGDILALSEQMHQAAEITDTVSELADRSNLLALNAGIEAAKAGEHGRGFAVVANEVRLLADQSKAAGEEVRTILTEIGRRTSATVMATEESTRVVEHGRERAVAAGEVIEQLLDTIHESAASSDVIAAAAREQRVAVDQIAVAMTDVGEAANRFVRGARQTQEAVEGLNDVAHDLTGIVSRYHVGADA